MIRTLQEKGRIPVARMCVSCRFFQPFRHDNPARPHHCAFVDAAFGDEELRLDCPDHCTPLPTRLPTTGKPSSLNRDRPEEDPMSQTDIPGYTYGTDAVPRSPVSLGELELLQATLLLGEDDRTALRRSSDVLAPQIEAILDVCSTP